MDKTILVLMSSYNGEEYIEEQIQSLEMQRDVVCDILIRDDGSKDNTVEVIRKCQREYKNITLVTGENLGFAKSFWTLLQTARNHDFYAFCDQDDIWLPEKLSSAIKLLDGTDLNKPALYTSNVICCDSFGREINKKMFNGRKIDVYESLVRSILPGCTFVFNESARRKASLYNGRMYSHDWALYIITEAFGTVLYDNTCHIKYRLHGNNAIGAHNKAQDLMIKFKRLMKKSPNVRMNFAKDFYNTYQKELTGDLREQVYLMGHYQESLRNKKLLLKSRFFNERSFKLYVLLNRV